MILNTGGMRIGRSRRWRIRSTLMDLLQGMTLAIAAASAPLAAAAQVAPLAPSGWTFQAPTNDYSGATFKGRDGMSEAGVNHFIANASLQELVANAASHARPNGADQLRTVDVQPFADSGGLISGGVYESDGRRVMGFGLAVPHKAGGTMTCWYRFPAANQAPPEMAKFFTGCVEAAKRGDLVYKDEQRRVESRKQISATPIASGAGRPVEAILLDEYYISGVGGMVYPDYRPVVLFKDGIACRCLDLALADIDPSKLVQQRPDDIARWTKDAAAYTFTWPGDSEPTRIEFKFQRPKTFGADHRLNGYWSRLGGGGNTALGGDISVAVSSGFRFRPDGSFSTDRSASATAPGVVAGNTGTSAGRYRIDGYTLTLTYANGQVTTKSLFRSDGDSPVLWIGGDSFTQ